MEGNNGLLGAGLAALGVIGPGIGIGILTGLSTAAIGRNPDAAAQIRATFIIGAAFGAIVKSLVDDILMPPLGLLTGGLDFSNLMVVLKDGATAGLFYYLGRLDGRRPEIELGPALKRVAGEMQLSDYASEGRRCGEVVRERNEALKAAGAALQPRGVGR